MKIPMKKIGLVYSFASVKTSQQVKKLVAVLGESNVELIEVHNASGEALTKFSHLILGVSTWFDGELPNYWDELLPDLEDRSFKGKKVAIFGGGNQKEYPENFVDGIGIMARFMEARGAKVVGYTSVKGYTYESSKAQVGDQFMGLALDVENQAAQSAERIEKWANQLKTEFGLK
jgi:flavodoxin I